MNIIEFLNQLLYKIYIITILHCNFNYITITMLLLALLGFLHTHTCFILKEHMAPNLYWCSIQGNDSIRSGFYRGKLFEGSCAGGMSGTNFDAEILAVREAIYLRPNLTISYRHAGFLVDSLPMILILCSLQNSYSSEMEEVRQKVYKFTCNG